MRVTQLTQLQPFIESDACRSGRLCDGCRDPIKGPTLHRVWEKQGHAMPEGGLANGCPDGKPMRERVVRPAPLPPNLTPVVPHPLDGKIRAKEGRGPTAPATSTASPGTMPTAFTSPVFPPGLTPSVEVRVNGVLVKDRESPSLGQIGTWAKAATLGKYVADDVRAERSETCRGCEWGRWSVKEELLWCDVCGCGTGGMLTRKVMDLAAYEERLPEYGCKHPERAAGKGWKR